jgi:uncharacterized membrane protein
MLKGRLEAFSDGVIAIIITIMVLELKVPHGNDLTALRPLIPVFLSYVLSFIYIGIYWNNHHHLLQVVRLVNGRILWANLHAISALLIAEIPWFSLITNVCQIRLILISRSIKFGIEAKDRVTTVPRDAYINSQLPDSKL